MRKVRAICGVAAAIALSALIAGCGPKSDPLDTAAPPPKAPNAQREVSGNKRMPAAPPSVTGGPLVEPPDSKSKGAGPGGAPAPGSQMTGTGQ